MSVWPVLDPQARLELIKELDQQGQYAVAYDINKRTEPLYSDDPADRPQGGVYPEKRVLSITIRPGPGSGSLLGDRNKGTAEGALKAQQLIEELRKGNDPAREGGKPGFFGVDLPFELPDFLKKYGLFVLAAVVVVLVASR